MSSNVLLITLALLPFAQCLAQTSEILCLDDVNITSAIASKQLRHVRDAPVPNDSGGDGDAVKWSVINEHVDLVIPLVLEHLSSLDIEHLRLPDMNESISVPLLIMTYKAGLYLTDGLAYNLADIKRYGDSYMTYLNKNFVCQFYLIISNLQFEYNFVLKLMAIEGYGKIIGSLDNTIIFGELNINILTSKLELQDFRIIKFSKIHVQLDQTRLIREVTGAILTPLTNLFTDHITTSISDGLKEQMQIVLDDFDQTDPLQIRKFTNKMFGSLTKKPENE